MVLLRQKLKHSNHSFACLYNAITIGKTAFQYPYSIIRLHFNLQFQHRSSIWIIAGKNYCFPNCIQIQIFRMSQTSTSSIQCWFDVQDYPMHPHSNVNCKIWKDCKQNELQSVFVLSVLHFDVTKVNQVIFRIKRVNDDPDHDVQKVCPRVIKKIHWDAYGI